MTPREWLQVARYAWKRLREQQPLSQAAQLALYDLVMARAGGSPGREISQEAWAAELSVSRPALRDGLHELVAHGLVEPFPSYSGSRPPMYRLVEERVSAWARGTLRLDGDLFAGTNPPSYRDANDPATVPLQDGSGPATSRARVHAAVGAEVDGIDIVAEAGRVAAIVAARKALADACCSAMKAAGTQVPPLVRQEIEGWLTKGLTYADFEEAARKAALAGVKGFSWSIPFLTERLYERRPDLKPPAEEGDPVRLEDWRAGGTTP